MGLAEILNRRKYADVNFYNDDIRVLRSFVEYSSDNKTMRYMIYELEMLDRTGELRHFYKAIKLIRIIRLPKNAKQSLALMEMHAQVLSGIWEQGINFITVIANMIEPVPLGLMFLYGIQGVAEDLETAKRIADNDFAALCSLLQGSYRQLEFRLLNYEEVEWLREKMYSMKHLSVVRGLPKPRKGGTDFGDKGFGGTDPDPNSQDTTEEFIAGMSDKEYVVMVLSTPVEERVLRDWLTQTAKEMTRWNSQMQGSSAINFGVSIPMIYMANLGASSGWSHGYSDAESVGFAKTHTEGRSFSESVSMSQGVSQSTSVGHSMGIGENASISHSDGESASVSVGHTEGTSYSYNEGENVSFSHSKGISESFGVSQNHSTSDSVSETDSVNISHGLSNARSQSITDSHGYSKQDGYGYSWGRSQGTSHSESGGYNVGLPGGAIGANRGTSDTNSASSSFDSNVSHSAGESIGRSVSESISQTESFSNSIGSSLSKSRSVSDGIGISESRGVNESWSDSYGQSRGQSWGVSVNDSVTNSRGVNTTNGWSKGISQNESVSASQSQSFSTSVSRGFSKGHSVSDGVTNSWGRSQGTTVGISGSFSQATSASMGVGPSISFSKSFQWLDIEVKNIVTLLEFQNQRLMKALNGNGAFFTDVYVATPDEETKAAAQALAKSAWFDKSALVCPLQVMDLTEEEQSHLLYHFNAFSADTTMEGIPGHIGSYRYSTILLPEEQAAFTHLPRISEGGVYADVLDVPKFAVPSMRKGEIYMGKILSGERWTTRWGYLTPFDYRISSDEIMHGFFTGESRSGKTVAATRFIAELANKVKRNGKRMRIICMDPKQDWRILAKFIEPERFHFYSLGNPEFLPINLNVCKIPHNVYPQQWIDGIIEIYCRAYGLGERGKAVLSEAMFQLYEEAGVFVPNWREVAPERSRQVTLPRVYERLRRIKEELEDPRKSSKGRIGNDVRDAYARVLDRLQVFGRPFSIEAQLFGREDGMGIDDLIGKDDVVVLESYGLETTFKNFIFGCITSGFFKYAQAHEGGFLAPDQYETVLVIEEANEVLTGQDTNSKSGNTSPLPGQSEFEKILDQAAGLGLFIFSITQKIADMPSSIIANSGLVFAGKISREEDINTIIRKIGREERYDDRDLVKWFPRAPIGWFVCRSSRNYDFKEVEPVLVKIAPLDVKPPTNEELLHIMALKNAIMQKKKEGA